MYQLRWCSKAEYIRDGYFAVTYISPVCTHMGCMLLGSRCLVNAGHMWLGNILPCAMLRSCYAHVTLMSRSCLTNVLLLSGTLPYTWYLLKQTTLSRVLYWFIGGIRTYACRFYTFLTFLTVFFFFFHSFCPTSLRRGYIGDRHNII